ncbi:hypothetical protein [Robinsoniella peoriensis]
MASIYVRMKDGTTRKFEHEGRSGGSYTKSIRYEGCFAIIKDEWGGRNSYPGRRYFRGKSRKRKTMVN